MAGPLPLSHSTLLASQWAESGTTEVKVQFTLAIVCYILTNSDLSGLVSEVPTAAEKRVLYYSAKYSRCPTDFEVHTITICLCFGEHRMRPTRNNHQIYALIY